MSGWPSDNGPADAQGGGEAVNVDSNATETHNGHQNGKQHANAAGWVDKVPYDYAKYATGPSQGDENMWDSSAKVYEWDGEEGDIGPEHPELELALFGDPSKRDDTAGIDFQTIAEIKLFQEGPVRVEPVVKFDDGGFHPAMRRNIDLCGYKRPTPIQMYCIPAIHEGHDVIGIAQTGSGKTAAYLIPILNKLMGKAKKLAAPRPNPATYQVGVDAPVRAEPLVVVVVPSRELAIQIFNEARKFCYRSMLRPCVVYGGGPMRAQLDQLAKGCDILIASPGRLIDVMERPAHLSLRRVKYMVIDEADEMLQDDWEEEFSRILSGGEQEEGNINYLLFSATFPKKTRDLAKTHLSENHVRFRVGRAGSTHQNIKQNVIFTEPSLKRTALIDLINSQPPQRTIIFVNSKRIADELDDFIFNSGFPCTSMHSDRTQKEREDAMRAFRRGDTPILITTGVAARGIDVRNVAHVINYDLPSVDYGGIEEYTHRIGRTGRIGHRGTASSFYTERDEPIASVLTRTLLETNQTVPEFLESYIPEGDARINLKFEADSDWESETGGDAAGDGWGEAGDNANGDAGSDAGGDADAGGWGAAGDDNTPAQASGWGAADAGEPKQDSGPKASGWGNVEEPKQSSGPKASGWGNVEEPKQSPGPKASGWGNVEEPKQSSGPKVSGWGNVEEPAKPAKPAKQVNNNNDWGAQAKTSGGSGWGTGGSGNGGSNW